MKKVLWFVSIIAILVLFVGGCGAFKGIEAASNRSHMSKLAIGMSKDDVLKAMGKPYRTAGSEKNGTKVEKWFYLIDTSPNLIIESNERFTLLQFSDGTLQSWND